MGIFDIFKKKDKSYDRVFNATDDNFTVQVIQRSYKTLIMVDFWAAWCGPCRMLGPILERMADKPDAVFELAKLDTENNRRMASRYKIQSIPAVKFFRNGQVVGEFVGVQMERNINRFIDEILADAAPKPSLKMSGNPAKRLEQARAYLNKGKGFQAAIVLRDFPESEQLETAVSFQPLAQFLWDINDGDAYTGVEPLDDAYDQAFASMQKRSGKGALETLRSAVGFGDEEQQAQTQKVITSLEAFLG